MSKSQVAKWPDRFSPFGEHFVSLPSLRVNKLYISSNRGRTIYKQELISDQLKEIVKKILKNDYDIEDMYDLLPKYEQQMLNDCLFKSKLENIFSFNSDVNKNKLIQQFNVMKGEILEGNNSVLLLNDFEKLLNKLFNEKMLTKTEFNKLNNLLNYKAS